MIDSLHAHAEDLADYLNDDVLDNDWISSADILEALASLGVTLVEDQIGDSALSYYKLLSD